MGGAFGYVYIWSTVCAVFGVLAMNKFKFNKSNVGAKFSVIQDEQRVELQEHAAGVRYLPAADRLRWLSWIRGRRDRRGRHTGPPPGSAVVVPAIFSRCFRIVEKRWPERPFRVWRDGSVCAYPIAYGAIGYASAGYTRIFREQPAIAT